MAGFETLIRGGRVVDGSGNPWFYGDVAIVGDRIAAVAPRGLLSAAEAGGQGQGEQNPADARPGNHLSFLIPLLPGRFIGVVT